MHEHERYVFSELEPIFMQSGYSAIASYDSESDMAKITLLLEDNKRFSYTLKADIYPDQTEKDGIAKEALAIAIQETIERYESWRNNNV